MKEVMAPTLEATEPKVSHLDLSIPSNKPIFICLVEMETDDLGRAYIGRDFFNSNGVDIRNATNVDMNAAGATLDGRGVLHDEMGGTYAISAVDSESKYTKGLQDCTCLVVSGISKKTGENISFLTHQDPKEFMGKHRNEFIDALEGQLDKIKLKCKARTIDAVLLGGKLFPDPNYLGDKQKIRDEYLDPVALISSTVKDTLGFRPTIINGPKNKEDCSDEVYYVNNERKINLVRSNVKKMNKDFIYSDSKSKKGEDPWVFKH